MVRFGILGAGNIAHRFAASLAHEERAALVSASCRSVEKATAFLAEVPHATDARAYGSYDELLADPDVDAIYLALPHAYHHAWALRALRAGKAVLCEKPACISAAEMAEVAAVAREEGVLFMEAMKPRFTTLYQRVLQLLPHIGDLVELRASLCNDMLGFVEGSGSYHMMPGPGAGVALDCGTYCASWIEELCGDDARLTSLAGTAQDGIDVYVDAWFAAGDVRVQLECAFDRAKPRQAVIRGTRGTILVDDLHRPQHATACIAGEVSDIDAPHEVDDFFGEIHHFVGLMEAGATESPVMSLDDSLRCAKLLDAVRAGFRPTPTTLETLSEQERILRYPKVFGAREALALGNAIAELASDYDRGVTAKITRESDGMVLFAWSMDDKAPRNYGFAEGKRAAALESDHASVYPQVAAVLEGRAEQLFSRAPEVLPSAGAFPIRVGDEWVATVVVSGLHEGRDHELVVRALERVLDAQAPALTTVVM